MTETETKMIGPLTKPELISLLNQGTIDESYYCWHPSLQDWEQIIDVAELAIDRRGKIISSQILKKK